MKTKKIGWLAHLNKEGFLVVENVALPLNLKNPDYFCPPDIDKLMGYYPNFIRFSKVDWSPARFLEEMCGEVAKFCGNGYKGNKRKIMEELFAYFGGVHMERYFMENSMVVKKSSIST